MKRFFCFSAFTLLLLVFAFSSSAEKSEKEYKEYTVKYTNGEYVLYSENIEVKREGTILPILEYASSGNIVFDNVRIFESVDINDAVCSFSGSIFCDAGASLKICEGSDITFNCLNFDMLSAEADIKVLGGTLTLDGAKITSMSETAVYIDSEGTLKILNDTNISSEKFDIITESAILFKDENEKYTGKDKFKICYIGTDDKLCNIAEFIGIPPVSLYADDGTELPIYRITYINEYADVFSDYRIRGEEIILPEGEKVVGYDFCGWILDSTALPSQLVANSSMTLHADYRLQSASFSVKSLDFKYDGKFHMVSPQNISHPYLSEGTLSYKWYKDGSFVSDEKTLILRDVLDSGEYTLEIKFEYGSHTSLGCVSGIRLNIAPATLRLEYLDGKFEIIEGELINGDTPVINTVEKDGKIIAETDNYNYCLEFSPQKPENKVLSLQILGWSVLLLILLTIAAYFVFCSAEKDMQIASVKKSGKEEFLNDFFVKERYGSEEICDELFAVDKIKADGLLSDRMAKGMIKKGGALQIFGSGFSEISLGVINEHFNSGDTVNINILKDRGLVAENSFRLKITSNGFLDKSLRVMANEFDISAVKMITLTGGSAIKIKSIKKKKSM